MKVIEQSDKRVWISSEAALWGKALCWCFSLATLSLLYWGESTATYVIAVVGALFWYLITTSVAETIFDIENDKVYGRYRIAGVNLRNIEATLSSSKLISVWEKHNPNLYLAIASGKKYRVGDFWSVSEHDAFISNLLGVVSIDHDRNF
ncbi:MAG: hypothetical protein KUG81_07715 [Gammaproteobacteria bacterium]|nr:hypothetical protein [Gammaproteobacteria bacterium]